MHYVLYHQTRYQHKRLGFESLKTCVLSVNAYDFHYETVQALRLGIQVQKLEFRDAWVQIFLEQKVK